MTEPNAESAWDCEECGEPTDSLTILVDPGGGDSIGLCDDCAAWWMHHAPDAHIDCSRAVD